MKKQEIINYLQGHARHDSGNGYYPMPSWDIKVYRTSSGEGNKKWDIRWNEYIESNDDLFQLCCEDGLRWLFEDKDLCYVFSWLEDYTVYTAGRMGGHIILESIIIKDYGKIKFNNDAYSVIDYEDIEYSILKKIYALFKRLDNFNATEAFNLQINFQRELKEEDWEEEEKAARAEREAKRGKRELKKEYNVENVYA